MDVFTFQYTQASSWSVGSFPAVDSEQTLVLVFGAHGFIQNDAAIKELNQYYPLATIVGCSTAGEIFDDKIYDDSLSVAVLCFKKTTLKFVCSGVSENESAEMISAKLASKLLDDELAAIMLFNDGLHINGSDIMRGLSQALPANIPVTGGMAGDSELFKCTWVLCNGAPKENHIIMLGLYGDALNFQYGSKGGWDIFGPERRVTRSDGNILYELDGKSALSLYKDYLGEMAVGLPATGVLYPLLVSDDEHQDVVRTIMGVNEEDGSLVLAGDIYPQARTRLMHANFDRLVTGASDAASDIKFNYDHQCSQALALAISCFGRRKVLKDQTEEEVEAVRDVLDKGIKMIGFYSYGEFSPLSTGVCELHNQTMTITVISERCDA